MSKLLDKCVILDVTFRKPGVTRRTKPGDATVVVGDDGDNGEQPDQSMVRVAKDILRSDTYVAIQRADRLLKQRIDLVAVPSPLKAGTWMIPVDSLEDVYDDIQATKAVREGLADKFVEEYPLRVEEARQRLCGLFRPQDYPSAERMRAAFVLETKVLEWGPPDQSKVGNEMLFGKLRAEFEANVRNAEAEVIAALRDGLLEMVGGLHELLKPKPDGKQRQIRDTRIEKVQAFLERLATRNVMADGELATLAQQAREVLAGKSPAAVRDNRDAIREQLSGVVEGLKALATERPGRKFRAD